MILYFAFAAAAAAYDVLYAVYCLKTKQYGAFAGAAALFCAAAAAAAVLI